MKKLSALIPLDGSAFSRQALPAACKLLAPDRYRVTLLRVAPPPRGVTPATPPPRPVAVDGWTETIEGVEPGWARELTEHPVYTSQIWESVRAELIDSLAEEERPLEQEGFEVALAVRFGEPAREIATFAEEEGVDVVVMATHGRSGLGATLLGSVAGGVVRGVEIPVLMVRPVPQPVASTG